MRETETHSSKTGGAVSSPPSSVLSPLATRARVRRLAIVGVALQMMLAVMILATAEDGVDINNIQLGFDFIVYHEASRLALNGELASAFEQDVLVAALAERMPSPDLAPGHYWLYPPTFALMITPLALLPYGAAFWVWTGLGFAAYGVAARALAKDNDAVLAAFGFTAVWVCAYHGQNGFFIAALFMTAMFGLLHRRDGLAGLAIGLLAVKPHLAILFPLALAAAGRWRAFGFAAATAVGFVSLSVLILGGDYLRAFIANMGNYAALMERPVHWMTTATVYMMMKLFGAATPLAWAVHGLVALCAAALAGLRCRQFGLTNETLALLVGASLMVSPYVTDYDLVVLAAAGLLLFAPGAGGAVKSRFDFEVALAAAMLPIAVVAIGRTGLQIGWLAPLAAVALAELRLRRRTMANATE